MQWQWLFGAVSFSTEPLSWDEHFGRWSFVSCTLHVVCGVFVNSVSIMRGTSLIRGALHGHGWRAFVVFLVLLDLGFLYFLTKSFPFSVIPFLFYFSFSQNSWRQSCLDEKKARHLFLFFTTIIFFYPLFLELDATECPFDFTALPSVRHVHTATRGLCALQFYSFFNISPVSQSDVHCLILPFLSVSTCVLVATCIPRRCPSPDIHWVVVVSCMLAPCTPCAADGFLTHPRCNRPYCTDIYSVRIFDMYENFYRCRRRRVRAGIEPTAAAPSQPGHPGVSRSDDSIGSKESALWQALI